MSSVEKSAKTVEEAIELAVTELGISVQEAEIVVLEQPSKSFFGFLGGKLARVLVSKKAIVNDVSTEITEIKETVESGVKAAGVSGKDPVMVAKEFLQQVCSAMKLKVFIEKLTVHDNIVLSLRGDDLAILIGKHGQTLDALQYLTNLAANRGADERIKIIVDVEDYRKRREDTLTQLAVRLAGRVKRERKDITLEPMNAHERKIIHIALQDDYKVVTLSEGEDPFRRVVISLKR